MLNSPLQKLTKRSEFLAVAQTGLKYITPAFILQIRKNISNDSICYGITASRKIGGAVKRNFAKRRLRALIHQTLLKYGHPGTEYVFIARAQILRIKFPQLTEDLEMLLKKIS